MVDLPTNDESATLAQAPTNRVSGRQYALSGSYLAQGLDKLSAGLDDVAVPLAQQQAASDLATNKVSRDENGRIIVGQPAGMSILGPAGQAYDHAIAAGALAEGDANQWQTDARFAAFDRERERTAASIASETDAAAG